MTKAIIFPATIEPPEERYGSVLHHALHLGKHGSVFWHLNVPGKETASKFNHSEVSKAYIYVSSVQKVLYVCEIDFIGSIEELSDNKILEQNVPSWRKSDWKASLKNPHGFWVLITSIKELKHARNLEEFRKFGKQEHLVGPLRL